jgi:hypothetical protein
LHRSEGGCSVGLPLLCAHLQCIGERARKISIFMQFFEICNFCLYTRADRELMREIKWKKFRVGKISEAENAEKMQFLMCVGCFATRIYNLCAMRICLIYSPRCWCCTQVPSLAPSLKTDEPLFSGIGLDMIFFCVSTRGGFN